MNIYNVANLLYLCKIYIHGTFTLSEMPEFSYREKWYN
jgi:hypothetical protein